MPAPRIIKVFIASPGDLAVERRAFKDRHASTQAFIEFMRPRCVELARVLKMRWRSDNGRNSQEGVIMNHLPYCPGSLPTAPPPSKGKKLTIEVHGLPPYKDEHFSIRNVNHPRYDAFQALRHAAHKAMNGRAWYFGPVALDLIVRAPKLHANLTVLDYAAGIEDTLDGSSGCTFTYLPIVFEDDCQVVKWRSKHVKSKQESYRVIVTFL